MILLLLLPVRFEISDLKRFDAKTGEYLFANGEKTVKLSRRKTSSFDLAVGYERII